MAVGGGGGVGGWDKGMRGGEESRGGFHQHQRERGSRIPRGFGSVEILVVRGLVGLHCILKHTRACKHNTR